MTMATLGLITKLISPIYVNNMTSTMQQNHTNSKAYEHLYPSSYIAVDASKGEYNGRIYSIWNSNDTHFFRHYPKQRIKTAIL